MDNGFNNGGSDTKEFERLIKRLRDTLRSETEKFEKEKGVEVRLGSNVSKYNSEDTERFESLIRQIKKDKEAAEKGYRKARKVSCEYSPINDNSNKDAKIEELNMNISSLNMLHSQLFSLSMAYGLELRDAGLLEEFELLKTKINQVATDLEKQLEELI